MNTVILGWIAIAISVIAALAGMAVIAYVLITVTLQRRAASRMAAIRSKDGPLDLSSSEEESTGGQPVEEEVA